MAKKKVGRKKARRKVSKRRKPVRSALGSMRIGPNDSFEITAKNTGALKEDYPRIMVGFNTGPAMYKRVMAVAKREGYKSIKVRKISRAELDRTSRMLLD
jgi:hypothetical protein